MIPGKSRHVLQYVNIHWRIMTLLGWLKDGTTTAFVAVVQSRTMLVFDHRQLVNHNATLTQTASQSLLPSQPYHFMKTVFLFCFLSGPRH